MGTQVLHHKEDDRQLRFDRRDIRYGNMKWKWNDNEGIALGLF